MHFNDYLDNYSKPNQNDNTFEHNDVNSYHDLINKEDKVLNTIKTISNNPKKFKYTNQVLSSFQLDIIRTRGISNQRLYS